MNILLPLLAGLALLWAATRTYPYFLCRWLGVDDSRPTPAHRLRDGRDYVPTRTHVVFAHHFSVIAGAGPIVGPTLALAYGWAPGWLWILLGCILFGAVHDMTSMFVSVREDGRSIADMSRRALGAWGYIFFLAFLILILTLINAIFLNMSCKALTAAYPAALLKLAPDTTLLHTYVNAQGVRMGRIGGIATTSVLVITVCAPLIGWLIHRKRAPIGWIYALSALICLASVLLGFRWPILLDEPAWRYVMTGYVFLACWVPVGVVLQPRDFVNAQILYAGIVLMAVGALAYGFAGHTFSTPAWDIAAGARMTNGPLWPFLLITVACGAISGFHSLAATGTTVKQITAESDVRRVGYNAMILEGALAMLALVLIGAALPRAEYVNIVYPPLAQNSNPILAFAVAMGYALHHLARVPTAVGCVIGILVLEGFVVTTLDTSVRLCRYMLEEFWVFLFRHRAPAVLTHPFANTLLAVGLMLFFALNSTIMSAWKIFGAGNQLIAALAMTVVAVWLLQRLRPCWFSVVPALVMTVTTFATLGISLYRYHAAAGPGRLVAPGCGPLALASALLLVLATGVMAVALHHFIRHTFFRTAETAAEPEPPEAPLNL